MKPLLTILTDINVHKRNIKSWGFKFLSHPNETRSSSSKSNPSWAVFPIIIFLGWSCNAQITQGTKIVAVISDTDIAVAADSLAMDGSGKIKSRTLCKIQHAANFHIAAAHLVQYREAGFDAYATMSLALAAASGTFDEEVTAVEDALREQLLGALRFMYVMHRATYDKFAGEALSLNTERGILAFMIFGTVNNELVFSMRELAFTNGLIGPVSVQVRENKRVDCPGPRCPNPPIAMMGNFDNVAAFLPQLNQKWIFSELKSYELARFLVTYAVVTTESVGSPIDVIRISKDGANWIERKPGCQEKRKEKNPSAQKPKARKQRRRHKPS